MMGDVKVKSKGTKLLEGKMVDEMYIANSVTILRENSPRHFATNSVISRGRMADTVCHGAIQFSYFAPCTFFHHSLLLPLDSGLCTQHSGLVLMPTGHMMPIPGRLLFPQKMGLGGRAAWSPPFLPQM